ncbi:SDR family NAD(P)-dependent oxidoreductase [Candidatus Frankia alpina]|uniref:SDR family NAD(P)-dependent oxidoreductase n=1 Tax=Candidatus Frankia alpina TaxID=2699483 RepID=UPI0013D37B18|nr:SDR family NAD(P)-dependent oxidoreductase [Candidatus Frankia alpina]
MYVGARTPASVESGSIPGIRAQMDVQYFGTLEVTRAFAPQLAAAGTGAVVNILSAASWSSAPAIAPYAAFAAKITLDGVQAGAFEILVDETSVQLLAGLSGGVAAIYPELAKRV